MSVLPIVTYDDEVLRQESRSPSKRFPKRSKQLIDDMFDTMYNSDGVGLAAPQVGKLLRIFVADADPMAEEEDEALYGPIGR
ncbi:MAG: peptide deformylase [Fodinibius sp.]|nr:peptide deformylase [Fodinibius sp.]